MKIYRGTPDGFVSVNGQPLPPRLDLANHSPTGFAWGYGGSGPAQLALAILADYLGDGQKALPLYPAFKWEIIAELSYGQPFVLTDDEIGAWLGVNAPAYLSNVRIEE